MQIKAYSENEFLHVGLVSARTWHHFVICKNVRRKEDYYDNQRSKRKE